MGSEKYPEENKFDSFLRTNGGACNAYTDCEIVSRTHVCSLVWFRDAMAWMIKIGTSSV